jgi:hypothetical protein
METAAQPFAEYEARAYVRHHDAAARDLSRMNRASLQALELDALSATGAQRLYGGPVSKDELASSILELRFPRISAARQVVAEAVSE